MREQLLEVLVEPGTGARLELHVTEARGDRIQEGTLVSSVTGTRYPITRGIPRFVGPSQYTDSFGMQWNRFRDVQLDSTSGLSDSRRRFDSETGWADADLRDSWTLDAGCGAGRFAEIAAARGARLVALDFSSAVDAAAQTLAPFDNAEVVQGNLLMPPFREGTFDRAYSIGVVQHTPNPAAAIQSVLGCVKRNGQFAFTIYARRPWTKLYSKYLVRPLTRRLPAPMLLSGIEAVMPFVFPVADRLFHIPRLGTLFRFAVPVAIYAKREGESQKHRYAEAVLDTFDMLSPRYDSPMTWQEVEYILRRAATEWTFRQKVPVNVVGIR